MNFPTSIDIFCAVVDNFGDIGVCWRLARQLATDYHIKTRLYVDNPDALSAIQPSPDLSVEIHHWTPALPYTDAADCVIEAFACTLPDNVIAAMVQNQSVWIDLEYMTAEDWAIGCHALPSPHPTIKLKKSMFFPGFDTRTGGLIREKDLIDHRNAFQNDIKIENSWRNTYKLPEKDKNITDISLFSYKTAPLDRFFADISGSRKPVRVFRPIPGGSAPALVQQTGNLSLYDIPFFPQAEYDRFLWACDLNFVRGEDSLVRAQWAGKPFIWNIYVQDKSAHLLKLRAFLEKIRPFYDTDSWERLAYLHDLWNEGGRNNQEYGQDPWRTSLESLGSLGSAARNWAEHLGNQTDLVTRLLTFVSHQKIEKHR